MPKFTTLVRVWVTKTPGRYVCVRAYPDSKVRYYLYVENEDYDEKEWRNKHLSKEKARALVEKYGHGTNASDGKTYSHEELLATFF